MIEFGLIPGDPLEHGDVVDSQEYLYVYNKRSPWYGYTVSARYRQTVLDGRKVDVKPRIDPGGSLCNHPYTNLAYTSLRRIDKVGVIDD